MLFNIHVGVELQSELISNVIEKLLKVFFLQYFFVFFSLSLKLISMILACTHSDMNFNWRQLPQGKFLHLRGHVDLNYCSCLQ